MPQVSKRLEGGFVRGRTCLVARMPSFVSQWLPKVTLEEPMEQLEADHIDIVKLDCEGSSLKPEEMKNISPLITRISQIKLEDNFLTEFIHELQCSSVATSPQLSGLRAPPALGSSVANLSHIFQLDRADRLIRVIRAISGQISSQLFSRPHENPRSMSFAEN